MVLAPIAEREQLRIFVVQRYKKKSRFASFWAVIFYFFLKC